MILNMVVPLRCSNIKCVINILNVITTDAPKPVRPALLTGNSKFKTNVRLHIVCVLNSVY